MAYDHFKTVNYTGGNNPNGDNYTWSHTANWVTVSQVGTTDEWKFAVSDNNTSNTRNATFTVTHWLSTQSNEISASFEITQYADGGVIATTLATSATTTPTNATSATTTPTNATSATTTPTNATSATTEATSATTLATGNTTSGGGSGLTPTISFDNSTISVPSAGQSTIIGFQVDAGSAQNHYNNGGTASNMYNYNGSTTGITAGTIHWVDSNGNAASQPSWVTGVASGPSVTESGDGQIIITFDENVEASTTLPVLETR